MEQINKELQKIVQDQTAQSPQYSDLPIILTEEEQNQAIDWAIKQEIRRYTNSMNEKGEHPAKIEQKVKDRNWLAEIDVQAVILRSNFLKHRELEQAQEREERKNKAIEARQKLQDEWNANRFYSKIKRHFLHKHGQFFCNAQNEGFIKAVCFLFSADQRYEKELNFSFNKGLLIQGTAGLGKTEVIRAVSDNPLWPVKIISILEVAEAVQETGQCNLYTNQMLLIDDVGTEPEIINHYGTKINWFKDFIELYYMNHRTFGGLIITTNLGGDEIEKRYGYRVRSRMREMFNTIQLTGTDLRGKV